MLLRRAIAAISLAVLVAPVAADAQPQPAKSGPLSKVDSALQQLRADRLAGRDVVRLGRSRQLRVSAAQRVLVDVYVRGSVRAAAGRLRAAGMDVRATSTRAPFLIAEGWLPVTSISRVARLGSTEAVTAVTAFGTNAGSVQSQGDAAHRGPAARSLGPRGAGVKVGLLSDSINQVGGGVADSVASGDLPASVQVLSDEPGGSDEGRAMAEIVYDGAPGITRMAFASGTTSGAVGKANAITSLVNNGARVIADDIFYLTEPYFQDGVVSQATDAARARNVAYFASAGNRATQSYERTLRATAGCPAAVPPPDLCHDFGGGDHIQQVETLATNERLTFVLQWDEPWGRAQSDIDVYLVNADNGAALPASNGTSDNVASGLPMEIASYTNLAGDVPVGIVIQRFAASRAPYMKYIALGNFGSFSVDEHDTASSTIDPDATAARGALSVAAVNWADPGLNTPEPFSSRGLVRRLFSRTGARLSSPDLRQKPDIAAADGVATTVPGFNPFFGTSAAAPSAAAVGALIRSAKATNTAADVYAILRSSRSGIDCAVAGYPDRDCGYGFVRADAAIRMATDPSPPTITVTRTRPDGRRGWYRGRHSVNVSWSVSDSGSPVTSTSGCGATTITRDTRGTTLTCTAHSAGGNASESVTIRRDSRRPRVSRLLAARSFRVNRRGRATSAIRRGTRLRFRLSERSTVTIKVQRRVRGRYRTVRTFRRRGRRGRNTARFSGRIKRRSRARALKAGRYRFRVQAADTAGNRSSVRTRRFRIRK